MKKIFAFLCFTAVVIACSSNDEEKVADNNFDKTALLTNWADNIIIPSYENYQQKINILAATAATFTAVPNTENLSALRNSWLEAYKAYQYVAIYNIGKAQDISFKEISNTFPTSKTGIDENIASGTYNLNLFPQYTRQGFPGLDYLINGLGTNDATIVGFYSSNANATNYKNYLTAVIAKMKANADAIVTDWNGGFRDSFISNNGSTNSGSFSKITNNFIKSFERDIRSGKVGIPAGLFSEGTRPEDVEAFYKNDVSKELLNISLKAAQEFFNGKHFDSDATGESLKSYLDYMNAVRNGQKLSDIINNQFTTIFSATSALGNSLSQQVTTDNSKMLTAHDALQQNLIYLKLDMVLALKISIDYVDGDGD